MALIYTYPLKEQPVGDDLLVLSDSADENKTKRITVDSIRGATTSGVSQIVAGTNVTISPPTGTGVVTINASGGGGSGTVTSVGLSMPAAFAVANSPVTTSGTLAVTTTGGSSGQYLDYQGNWSTPANTTNITLTTSGTSGAATWDGTTLNIPQYSSGGGSGVTSFTNANGTYISAGTVNTNATGAVTVGTIDLSAVDGTAVAGTRFLSKDNTWDVPAYTTYNAASSSNLGLMRLFSDTEQSVGANTVTSESGRTYGIQFNADNQAVVNVPWTDTDTNTNIYTTDGTLSGARSITMDGNQLNLDQSTTGNYIRMNAPTANASAVFIDGRRNNATRAKLSLNSGSGRLELFHFGSTKYVDLNPGGINYFLTDTAIGNTTASAKLHIKGGSGADSLLVENNAGTDILNIKDSGAFTLGLGATNNGSGPENSVAIGNSATIQSSAGSAVAIGSGASANSFGVSIGGSASGTAGGAIAIGTSATTGNSFGAIAIGYDADVSSANPSAIAIGSYINASGANSITFNATNVNSVNASAADTFGVYMTSNTTPDFKVVGGGTSDLQTKLDLSEQLLIRGDGSANAGNLKLNCYANSHHVNLIGPDHTGAVSYNIKFPNAGPGANNKILESDSSGNLSWIDTPSGGGGSSKLGFTPLSIYGATHEIASGASGKTIYRQSVVETDCVIDKVDFFVTAVTGTCNLTVAVYVGNLTTATRVLVGTSGALTTGVNTITFTSSYTFSAGDDIVIYTSQSAGEEVSNSIAGDSGLLNNSLLSRRSASYSATPPTSISPPETSGAEGLALHFYDE